MVLVEDLMRDKLHKHVVYLSPPPRNKTSLKQFSFGWIKTFQRMIQESKDIYCRSAVI